MERRTGSHGYARLHHALIASLPARIKNMIVAFSPGLKLFRPVEPALRRGLRTAAVGGVPAGSACPASLSQDQEKPLSRNEFPGEILQDISAVVEYDSPSLSGASPPGRALVPGRGRLDSNRALFRSSHGAAALPWPCLALAIRLAHDAPPGRPCGDSFSPPFQGELT